MCCTFRACAEMQMSWKLNKIAWLTDGLMFLVILIPFCFSVALLFPLFFSFNFAQPVHRALWQYLTARPALIYSLTKAIGMQSTHALQQQQKNKNNKIAYNNHNSTAACRESQIAELYF